MKAFITGISGQDGSYLSEYLLSLGYEVHGILRRHSVSHTQDDRIKHLPVKTYYGDLSDQCSLEKILTEIQPDEIYNLAAMSHVRVSFDVPQYTAQVNALGVLNLLEAYRKCCPKAKFYQASSSEMFGSSVDADGFQRETTPMQPVSPYGVSKLFAYHMVNNYRDSYGLFACNGILFNHSSPRRGEAFVEQKIVKTACEIKYGVKSVLELGNVFSSRDFGHSKDYVRAMHLILQQDKPDNYVVSMQKTITIDEVLHYVFNKIGLTVKEHCKMDRKLCRPKELEYLKGDSSKIRSLGWKPEYTFESMIDEMINYWMDNL